jgi:hypothetical protein
MAKRTTVNYADTYIQALEPFHTGNPRGGLWGDDSSTVMHLGKLPEPYRSQIYGSPGLVYVVYSYQTPIAWVTSDGKTHIPDVKYSVTTTKHQHITRKALS